MLTFFEYLRQRAYQSILAGAQEALHNLDGNGAQMPPAPSQQQETAPLKELKGPQAASSLPSLDPQEFDPDAYLNHPSGLAPHQIPPPRRRGRPSNK